jgi:Domain of Unknown Function (DUF1206)
VTGLREAVARSDAAEVADTARRDAETVERSRAFRWLVRAGFIARGITYGVIGALALAIALGAGTGGATPNQQGALALISRTPLGRVALVVISAGLIAYALWRLTQGILGRGPEGGGGTKLWDRISNLASGVVYLGFFAVAVRVLTGSAGNASSEPRRAAGGVLGWPGGQLIVGIGGGVLIAISLFQAYDAIRGGFTSQIKTEQMGPRERRAFMLLGEVGLVARALAFALVGYFLLRAAIDFNANAAVGLDGALARLRGEPLGPWVLGLVAAGLLVFAVYSVLEARHRRL